MMFEILCLSLHVLIEKGAVSISRPRMVLSTFIYEIEMATLSSVWDEEAQSTL